MKINRAYIAAFHDILMAGVSLFCSLYLRLGVEFSESYPFLWPSVGLFTAVCAVVFSAMGLYKGVWRYASLRDLLSIGRAVALATLIFLPLLFMVTRLEDFPRSVLVINALVLMALLGGPRIVYRMVKDKDISLNFLDSGVDSRTPILLVGIGESAVHFLRAASSEYKVVGLVDKNRKQAGSFIHGVRVFGSVEDIPKAVKRLRAENNTPQKIILARECLDNETVAKLVALGEELGVPLAKLPRMSDFNAQVDRLDIKPIAIEDLLGRSQVPPSLGRREELIRGRTILVTGAGGTIGSELVRQIAAYQPNTLILVEISEYNLYQIDKELAEKNVSTRVVSLIGDVRNEGFLDRIFSQYRPEIVFHAAALKHVPIVENNIIEAFLTNVIGSKNVAAMSLKYKAQRMVMVSTDKAVNPTSLMGVTKRVAEYYVQGLGSGEGGDTVFSTVRFGNVLGSSGSVIPLFQRQLERGGPITVTHPDMVRYFMTVPEAVELILQASTLPAEGGQANLFVLDMGKPVRILDLARQMISLAGLKPEEDIHIEFTGIRKGEKLYEELFYDNEERQETLYEGIIRATAAPVDFRSIVHQIEQIRSACLHQKEVQVVALLASMVPQYACETEDEKRKVA